MTRPLRSTDPSRIGDYELIGRIGGGGMGDVFLGRSPGGRSVAVKVVRDLLADDPRFRERFRREVDAARSVSGAYTAAVLDADPEAERPWLATAYIDGPSLLDRVTEGGPLAEAEARRLGAGLAEALRDIHRAGLVHRDLKPGNVLLAADGPRLIDFGIIRAEDGEGLTETGYVLGSAGFMAPEQAAGGEATAAADVYALGAVLTFAVTGHGPFGSGPTPGVLLRQASGDLDISGVPEGLQGVVARCLNILPGGRPTTDSLLELLGGKAIEDAVAFDDDQKPVSAQDAEIAASATTKMRAEPGKGAKSKQGAKTKQGEKAAKNTQRAHSTQSTQSTQSIQKQHLAKQTIHHDPTPTRRKFLLLGLTTAAVAAFAWGVDEMPHGDGKTTGAETADDGSATTGGLTTVATPGVLGGPLKNPTWTAKATSQAELLTLSGDTLVVAGQGLTGYDTATGTRRWNVGSGTYSAPTEGALPAVGDTVYEAAYGSGDMVAVRAADGTETWRVPQPPKWLPSALVGASADVVVGLSYTDAEANSGEGLWAVDTRQRRELWHAPIGPADGAPHYSAGTDLILLSQPQSYQLTAYDAKTGRQAWNAKDTAPRSSSPAFATAVASHGTTVYWATYQLYAYDQQGRPLWPVGVSEGGSGQFHAVIADDDTVYAAAENDIGGSVIAAYKASDGAAVWRVAWPKGSKFYSAALEAQLALAGGTLYVADRTNGDLIAVNAKTGETLWQFHDPNAKSGDNWQVAADERGVYACYGTTVCAFLVT